jgi:hypothetical protein
MNRREVLKSLLALPIVKEISVARLAPDDVVVLQLTGHLTMDMRERVREDLRVVFPDRKCLVLDDSASLRVVKSA